VTSKRLRRTVGQHEQHKHMRLTDEPPSITSLMYLHPRRRDVRGITEEGKPHIFDMQIVECLVKRAVELVSLTKRVGQWPSRDGRVGIQLCKPREGM
jgi:hypothetical protein